MREIPEWTRTPEGAVEYWGKLSFEEQIALEWAATQYRLKAQAQVEALKADIQARCQNGTPL